MLINHYTKSIHKSSTSAIINAGTSNDNTKVIELSTVYKNPVFYPRKFTNWPDTFSVELIDNNSIKVCRTDTPSLGWGENLLIDVEFELENSLNILLEQKIPRIIYQTFSFYDVPQGMGDAITSWINLNTDYEHYFFDNEDSIAFIEKYFDKSVLEAYLTLIPGAFKADLWRCCVLYEKGGVYVDADMVCLKSLRDFIDSDDEFIVPRDDPMAKKFLYNGFMASQPKHPFMLEQINRIVKNVKELKECYYLDISGPALLGKSVNNILNRNEETDFDLDKQIINNFKINILQHEWTTKTIKNINGNNLILTEYPNKNSEMAAKNIPTYYSLYQKNIVYQSIPRNIYYTAHDHTDINNYMVQSFKNKNKYWKLNFYDDDDCINFFKNNNHEFQKLLSIDALSFFNSLENGGERSDFWRYCIIYLYGGFYTDTDTFCNISLDKWIRHHDLILGIEALLPLSEAETFGMDQIGQIINDQVVSVCNWSFAAAPKHNFFKDLILDIYHNPIKNNVLLNTGPARITKHAKAYFEGLDLLTLESNDIEKNKSVLFSINRFGSNQLHSKAYKNFSNAMDAEDRNDVYIIHMFDGSWRVRPNKKIKIFQSNLGVSHNLTIIPKDSGYKGITRLDKNTSRTRFMECIGDCRSLVEYDFDQNFTLRSEIEKPIVGYHEPAKFEDYRFFVFNNQEYLSVSYIDQEFNTRVAILDSYYNYLGNVNIDQYNEVSWMNKTKVWEKNWLFFEKNNELYFIYNTIPNYIIYKCLNFKNLLFQKHIDIPWLSEYGIPPESEYYFTANIGSKQKIAVGGSSNPIFLNDRNMYMYFIHTKIYNIGKYNHYLVLLNNDLTPFKLITEPLIKDLVPYSLMFVSSAIDDGDYITFSGGIGDNSNFIWSLSKDQIYKFIDK